MVFVEKRMKIDINQRSNWFQAIKTRQTNLNLCAVDFPFAQMLIENNIFASFFPSAASVVENH